MIKVLIVEDDPMVALINRKYLEKIGDFKIYGPVKNEDEIIYMIENENINLILLDVFLPNKNGIDILKTLRLKEYLLDIIMVTAANSSDELERCFSYGVTDYLVKPFEFDRFSEAINKFKAKNSLLSKSSYITQKEIDYIYNKKTYTKEVELPKGLNKRTLEKIETFLYQNSDRVWTLREIAKELNISNVTIKKYMDYLETIDKIYAQLTSGNIGRPEIIYKIIK